MRASRLLSIQMMLETRGRLSARELADALEISVRTLYRDIDQLSAAGVPVFAERGRAGGFQLLPGWKTTLTGLTPGEAQAVFLGGLAGPSGPAAELGFGGEVQRAQLKLLTALPAAWRNDAQRIASRLYLDPVDWYHEAQALPHLATVAAAVWDERQLTLHYESWKTTASHTVHPLGLVLKGGAWYLVAAAGRQPRTFRVSSILAVTPLQAPARRPRGFDLPAWWRASVQRFEHELFQSEARVRATPAGLKQLGQIGSLVAKAVAAARTAAKQGDEPIELSIPVESTTLAARQLLTLAPEVEVLGPAVLRKAIVQRLAQLQRLYAGRRHTTHPRRPR